MSSIMASIPASRDYRIAQLLDAQHEVLSLISRNAPLEQSLNSIARFSERWIDGMKGSILRFDASTGRLARGGYGQLPASFADVVDGLVPAPFAGSCGACAYHKRRVISTDVFTDPHWADFHGLCREYGIRSAWSSPLIAARDGSLLGVFGMYHPAIRVMNEADEELVNHFADLAAMAIERHNDQALQHHLATHDRLTGLGNRRLLETEGPRMRAAASRSGSDLCVAFIDLDNFKSVNDTFGHTLADELLEKVAQCMREYFGPDSLVTRFGGDEFVVLCPEPQSAMLQRLEGLRQLLGAGISMGPLQIDVRFSAGIVDHRSAEHETRFDSLISASDDMARRAKSAGGDRCVSADRTATTQWTARNQLSLQLTRALKAENAIVPHLQPIVALPDGTLQGFEFLLRLRDPQLAALPIGECIEVAEQSGLITDIGQRMLKAAADLLQSHPTHFAGLTLNVNVSVRQLLSRDFLNSLRQLLLGREHLAPQICLEVTESHWLDATGPAGDLLRQIRDLGFGVALDDFGTGHASLSYLQSLPFTSVKIDRHFIQHLESSPRDAALCVALLAMAQSCGMTAVAEGVESVGQAARLATMGYDRAQGYLWSRPMPIDEALRWAQGAQQRH